MSVFSAKSMSPDELLGMRRDAAAAGRDLASFDAAITAEGVAVPVEADPESVRLHQRYGVARDPQPGQYDFTWRDPNAVTPADLTAARIWAASMRMPPGLARSIVERVEEITPEIAALGQHDLAERKAKAALFVGGDKAYDATLAKAREALKAGGDFKFLGPDSLALLADPWTLATLARFHDARTSLQVALDARKK